MPRFKRYLALLIALLFLSLTFLAERPHGHVRINTSPEITAFAGQADAPGDCPLCQWMVMDYVTPAVENITVSVVAVAIPATFIPSLFSLCCPATPHRSLRAPPVYSC